MPKDIRLSDGTTKKGCILLVINVTGINEERGFRLGWSNDKGQTYTPARGLATSNPFKYAAQAVDWAYCQLKKEVCYLLLRPGALRIMHHPIPDGHAYSHVPGLPETWPDRENDENEITHLQSAP